MGTRTFHFPNSTGSFYTAYGNLRIYIRHTIAGMVTENYDMATYPDQMGELEFPFEVDPSAQTMRFPSIKIRMPNIGNIFESPYQVFDKTNQHYQTLITILKDGSDIWWGIIDYDTITYSDWYLDGATWKYRYVGFTAYDRLAYLWWNNKTLGDIGAWGAYNNFKTKMEGALTLALGAASFTWDTAMSMIEEDSVTYDYTEWEFTNLILTSSTLLSQWLKDCMLMLGLWIYNWGGTWKIVRRTGGASLAIATTDLVEDITKSQDTKPIEYVKIQSIKNWAHVVAGLSSDLTYSKEYGNSAAPTARQFILLDPNRLLADLEVEYDGVGTTQFGDSDSDAADLTYCEDALEMSLYTQDIETGIRFTFLDSSSGVHESIITEITSADRVTFYSLGVMPDITKSWIIGHSPWQTRLWKLCRMLRDVASIYNIYFLTSRDNYKFILKGIATYTNFHSTFTFNSLSLKAINVKINFILNRMTLLTRRIA